LLTLYEKDKSIPWFYYWTTNEVHMDPIFGYTSCCFWTSEEHKDLYAWHVNFLRGKAYPSIKKGKKNQAAGSASLSVIRAVRGTLKGGSVADSKKELEAESKAKAKAVLGTESKAELGVKVNQLD
jgi:hypothetical protein